MEDAETLGRMSPDCAQLLVTATSDHSLLNNNPDHFVTSNPQLRAHLRRILGPNTRATVAEYGVEQSPLANGGVSLPGSAASLSMTTPQSDLLLNDASWLPDNLDTPTMREITDHTGVDFHLMSGPPSLTAPGSLSLRPLDLDYLVYAPGSELDLEFEESPENDQLMDEFVNNDEV